MSEEARGAPWFRWVGSQLVAKTSTRPQPRLLGTTASVLAYKLESSRSLGEARLRDVGTIWGVFWQKFSDRTRTTRKGRVTT